MMLSLYKDVSRIMSYNPTVSSILLIIFVILLIIALCNGKNAVGVFLQAVGILAIVAIAFLAHWIAGVAVSAIVLALFGFALFSRKK